MQFVLSNLRFIQENMQRVLDTVHINYEIACNYKDQDNENSNIIFSKTVLYNG